MKRSLDYTKLALESFFENTPLRSFDRFYLIDNDGSFSASFIPKEVFEKVSVVCPTTPRSFAQNVNEVMVEAFKERADLFFLNNDLIFPKGWLPPLLIPDISLTSPFSNREVQHTRDGFVWDRVCDKSDYEERKDSFLELAAAHIRSVRGSQQVIALPFFCIRIPYLVYQTLGPLDEGFGSGGGEDFDYCLRAAQKGIPVRYAAQSFVLHFNGKSTWSHESAEEESLRKNRYRDLFKKKWGANLTSLLIDEDLSVIERNREFQEMVKKGDIINLVSALR